MESNTTGFSNTAPGVSALAANTTGNDNTAIGQAALFQNTTASNNTAIGFLAAADVTTADNVICIGSRGANVGDSCYIGNIYGASIDPNNTLVGIDPSGKLGTQPSARRFKRDIQPMDNACEAILALKPVTFHYKNDVKSTPCFGLVAEDVEKESTSDRARQERRTP